MQSLLSQPHEKSIILHHALTEEQQWHNNAEKISAERKVFK